MVYSNKQIEEAIKDGRIVCEPFNRKHISEASLDVTLGYYYYRSERINERAVYNPFDREDVERYFDGPYKAIKHGTWARQNGILPLAGIPPEHHVIVLKPGERILAHTHEFVGIRPEGGASEIRSRSSWGRNGVAVCFDAGWIDPGYINRLTLEVYNLNQHESIVLPVGERVAQIIFHHTGEIKGDYGEGRGGFSGKYQTGTDLSSIIRSWTPDQMLPKAYNDRREVPRRIEGLPDEG